MDRALLPALLLALSACAANRAVAPLNAEPPETAPLLQLPADVRPLRYGLELEIDPDRPAGFRGTAAIEVELDGPRRTIWLHAQGLEIASVRAEPADGRPVDAKASSVHAPGVLRVDLSQPVGPGRATLRFAWSGAWRDHAGALRGRFGDSWYVGTFFEPIEARTVFPSFDEPRFKVPFALTLIVPDGLVAVANSPEASAERLPDGRRRVAFRTTRPLPTYLVFFAVGDYEVVDVSLPPNEVRATPLPGRLLVPRGRTSEAAFAAEAVRWLVPWQEWWFGIPFPYEKLDHVVVPGHSGAMENAGAIAYQESLLLWSPDRPVSAQHGMASVIAHEVSHQWFGNLVTPEWWTDIWLNESFATWMGVKAVHAWHPEWRRDLARLELSEEAKQTDALASARAIRQPLTRMEDVGGQFDGMSYQKGGAVIDMLSRYGGEDEFRAGLRTYLAARAHGTGSTPGLLADLSRAAGLDLAGPFSSFIEQAGLPLVRASVACEGAGARLVLAQSRYVQRGGGAVSAAIWKVPVCARYEAGGAVQRRCTLLDGPSAALVIPEGCPSWLIPDAGANGYYRWAMLAADLDRLRTRGLAHLDASERIGLGGALLAAQKAGENPYGATLDLLLLLAGDPDEMVALVAMPALADTHAWLFAGPDRTAFEALVRQTYRPAFDRLGWRERPGEPPSVGKARARLAGFLAFVGRDPGLRQEAARMGRAWLGMDGELPRADAVTPSLLGVALGVALQEGGTLVFQAILARARAPGTGLVRQTLFTALGEAEEPVLARRAVGLWKDPSLPLEDRFFAVMQMVGARRRPGPALDLMPGDLDDVLSNLGDPLWAAAVPEIVAGGCSESDAARMEAAFRARFERYPALEASTVRAAEAIRLCAAGRAADSAAAADWLARRVARPAG